LCEQRAETFEHQPTADEKDQRDGDFGDDEQLAEAILGGTGAAAGFVFQDVVDGDFGNGEAGSETEENRGGQRDRGEEGEYRKIESSAGEIGHGLQLGLGDGGEEQLNTPVGGEESDGGAGEREQQALNEHLQYEIGAAGAQSGPYGEFLAAGDGAGDEEIGDVCASDEENEADGSEE